MVDVHPCSSALTEAYVITPAPSKARLHRFGVANKSPVGTHGLGRQPLSVPAMELPQLHAHLSIPKPLISMPRASQVRPVLVLLK